MSDLFNDPGFTPEYDTDEAALMNILEPNSVPTPTGRPMPPDPFMAPKKKGGGVLGKVLCLVLGFVVGVGGTIGGVAGAGYYVATRPVKDTINTIGGLVGSEIKYQNFITEEYAQLTIAQLVGNVANVAQKFASGEGCLNDLNAISPMVSTSIDPLLKTIEEYGISITKDELMNLPFSQFPDFFMEALKDIELISVLNKAGVPETPILKALCYDQEGNPVKIRLFFEEGPEGLLQNIQLGTLLGVSPLDENPDPITLAIAYGEKGVHYNIVDGEIVWIGDNKPKTVGDLLNGDLTSLLKDIQLGTLLNTSPLDENPDPITLAVAYGEKGVHYNIVDGEIVWIGDNKPKTVGDLLNGDLTGLLEDIQLGTLFNTSPLDENPDPITLAVAYGEKGVHYNIVDGKIVWIGDNKPKTVGDLLNGDLTSLLEDIQLGTLLNTSPLDENPDPITLAVAYGEKGVHYNIVDGEIVWIGDNKPKTVGDLLNGDLTSLLEDIQLGTLLNVSPLDPAADPLTVALAYGEEGTHYNIVDGEIVWIGDNGPKTVGDLLGGDISVLLDDVQLGTLFNISPLDENPDPITLALAYGEEGTHYNIVDGEIIWIGDNKPKTVGDLLEGNLTETLNELKLGTLLGISPLDPYASEPTTPDPIMLTLAFGTEGVHYVLKEVNGQMEIQWLTNPETNELYKPHTLKDLTENADAIFNEMPLSTVLGVKIDDPDADALTHALSFGYEGTHYNVVGNEIVWVGDNGPRTVADMSDMGDIMNDLRIGTVLDCDPLDPNADELTLAIAYGYEGTHYKIENGEIVWIGDNGPRTVSDMSDMGNIINDIRLDTALNITHESPRLLVTLAYGAEGTGFNYIKDNEGNIIGIEELQPSRTISSLSSKENNVIDSLTLNDIIGKENIENDMILSHLGEETLDSLPATVAALTFKQIYPEQIYILRYENEAGDILTYEDPIFKDSEGNTYNKSEVIAMYHYTAVNGVATSGYISEQELYYNTTTQYYHRKSDHAMLTLELTPQWKYLLIGEDHITHDYKLTEFTSLVNNMTYNMTHATLYDLNEDHIISLDNQTLDTPLLSSINLGFTSISLPTYTDAEGNPITKLGQLTVEQMLEYTADVLAAINSLSQP